MDSSWEKATKAVLRFEGGYTVDSGGKTKYGISQRSYPNEDIEHLTVERAKELYKHDYWEKAGCYDLPYPLDIIVFDTAVNMGVSVAKDFLNKTQSIPDYLLLRIERYLHICGRNDRMRKYLLGWMRRCAILYNDYGDRKP